MTSVPGADRRPSTASDRPRYLRHRFTPVRAVVLTALVGLVMGTVQSPATAAVPSGASPSVSTAAPAATPAATTPISCPPAETLPVTSALGGTFDGIALDALQVATASTIGSVAGSMKISRRGVRIALAVATQESSLNPAAVRAGYVGLFQQQADTRTGLYTKYDRRDAAGASRMFFEQLLARVPGYATDGRLDWQIGEVIQQTDVGQNVAQWFGLSDALATQLATGPMITLVASANRTAATAPARVPGDTAAGATASAATRPAATASSGSAATSGSAGVAAAPSGLRASGAAFRLGGASPAALDIGYWLPVPVTTSTTTATTTTGTTVTTTGTAATTTTGTTVTTTGTTATTTGTAATTSAMPTTTATGPVPTSSAPVPTSAPAPTSAPTQATQSTPRSTASSSTPARTTAPTTATASTSTVPTVPVSSTAKRPTPTTGRPAPVTGVPSSKPAGPSAPSSTTAPSPSKPSAGAPVKQLPPPDVSVNPEPPEPPVPTNGSDPSVGADPKPTPQPAPAPKSSTPSTTPSTTPAVDCSPSTGGGSTTFNPGMIISDAVFYNTASMTAAEVRSFLNTKGASCTAAACLRTVRFSTPSEPADQYCKAYQGGTNEDVAAILQRLSVACGINPQVMLVTLQKESALLTRTDVSMANYNAAYGWHCPDTGPGGSANCDPQYAGFFNQAYGMAKQWSRYKVDPGKYNYRAGQTSTILWNVAETGCGGATVYIRNTATASLYNYTPYQPNAASLAAYPGVGDRCSSYGNRNFFFLFQKYFGTTGGGVDVNVGLNGVNVTLPSGPHVAAGAAGKVIVAPTPAVARGLAAGFAAIGLPYVYGGGTDGGPADQGCSRAGGASNSCEGIVGFDCSGLTAYVLKQAGYTIPTYSGAQRSAGQSVPWSAGRPGDIIGYQGHVAVYLGVIDGTQYLLEAPDVGMFVQVRPVYFSNGGVPVDSVLHRFWS